MMKNKRFPIAVLALTMLASIVAGCTSGNKEATNTSNAGQQSTGKKVGAESVADTTVERCYGFHRTRR